LKLFSGLSVALIYVLTGATFSYSQFNSSLELGLEMRGLTRDDITIPVNFNEASSSRAGFKLILPVVKEFMINPLKSFSFPDTLLAYAQLTPEELVLRLFGLIDFKPSNSRISKLSSVNNPQESVSNFFKDYISKKSPLTDFTIEERNFLNKKVLSAMSDADDDKGDNTDIFKFNAARDSSIANSKRTIELLNRTDKKVLYQKCYDELRFFLLLFEQSKNGRFKKLLDDSYYSEEENIDGDLCYYFEEEGLRIAIGGEGPNRYDGHFDMIIDLGGNDVYNLTKGTKSNTSIPSCIIDLGGNDLYESNQDFALASAYFGSSFIFDSAGDDVYKGAGTSLGSAICGLGMILDEAGNDIYRGVNHSIGAATFGVGLVHDMNGNDTYIANSSSQGFGMTGGIGVIADIKGNDSYIVDARSLDIGRYEDHYVSMCQGYGEGVRPYYAGGIGAIIEVEGNDLYNSDIFGQGGAYWFALGCIADRSGNDKYNSYQYGQGAGIHLAVGILKDYNGWDFYSSNGVSQGCGHDYGFGLLNDISGNDNYSAYSLSQGAGNANGIGIILDEEGRDGYLNKEPGNTRGYGNSRREYGSIGIFADASGEDFYSVPGFDSTYILNSMWGGFIDNALMPESKTGSASQGYRVQVDSSREYSLEDYMIMAKTIEPRFSLWKDYGFRKLVDDSLATSEFILKYLDTDDHRAALVLRDLAFRIGTSMSSVFIRELDNYLEATSNRGSLNPEQIAFICYLFGETGNSAGKEQLLDLTKDGNKRIRSSAINALGKIRIDSADSEFITSASERLQQLALENDSLGMLMKDIAFAFKKYAQPENVPTLIGILGNRNFGARFLSAECLSSLGESYYSQIRSERFNSIPAESPADVAFLHSLINADPKTMNYFLDSQSYDTQSTGYTMALSNLLKKKKIEFSDSDFEKRAEKIIDQIKNKTDQRIFKYDN